LAGPDFWLVLTIKFRPGASSLARVITHRKEEMHPVGFGRRRSIAGQPQGSTVGWSSSVFSQWASLTASLPGVFEANWSLSISPKSCRLSGPAYASKRDPQKLPTFGTKIMRQRKIVSNDLLGVRGSPRLTQNPKSCRLFGRDDASEHRRRASIMRAIKCLKSIRWMPWR
jgi:hypothetical protein